MHIFMHVLLTLGYMYVHVALMLSLGYMYVHVALMLSKSVLLQISAQLLLFPSSSPPRSWW